MTACEIFLSPDNQYVQMNEKVTKPRILKNLVKFLLN
jgi:hypothetical protein